MAQTTAPVRTIEEFLKQHKSLTNIKQIQAQRDERRDRFVAEVEALFKQIMKWLTKLAKDGPVFYRERPISIYEEGIGEYKISELLVDVADRLIIFRPVGTMIYGAYGRVDILGFSQIYLTMREWGKWKVSNREYRPGSAKQSLDNLTEAEFKNVLFMMVSD